MDEKGLSIRRRSSRSTASLTIGNYNCRAPPFQASQRRVRSVFPAPRIEHSVIQGDPNLERFREMKIRKLSCYFRANGFEHELVKRVGNTGASFDSGPLNVANREPTRLKVLGLSRLCFQFATTKGQIAPGWSEP
jgi:hypothetical protein